MDQDLLGDPVAPAKKRRRARIDPKRAAAYAKPMSRMPRRLRRDLRYPLHRAQHWEEFYFRDPAAQKNAWRVLRYLRDVKRNGDGDILATDADNTTDFYLRMRERIAMAYQPFLYKRVRTFMRRYGTMLSRDDWRDLVQTAQVIQILAVEHYLRPKTLQSAMRFRNAEEKKQQSHSWGTGKFVSYLGPLLDRSMRMSLFAMYSGFKTVSASQLLSPHWLEHEQSDSDMLDRMALRSGGMRDEPEAQEQRVHIDGQVMELRRRLNKAVEMKRIDLVTAGIVSATYPTIFTGMSGKREMDIDALATHYEIKPEDVARRLWHGLDIVAERDNVGKAPKPFIAARRLKPGENEARPLPVAKRAPGVHPKQQSLFV